MSSPAKATPRVPVPRSAADYSPRVLDSDLRSEVNAILLQQGHVARIQNHLTQTLAASPSNWSQKVHSRALAYIRSGEHATFPELMQRIMEDIKRDTENARKEEKKAHTNANDKAPKVQDREDDYGLAVPKKVEEEGFRITRECLEQVCDMVD